MSGTTADLATGVLLEREEALAALRAAFDQAAEGRGKLVLLTGEAGVGKTSVIRECRSRLQGRLVWGACDPLSTPRPLGPFIALAEHLGDEFQDVVASNAKPHEVVAALVRGLLAVAPSILVLEDVNWADEATLDVLRLLVRRLDAVPAVVVASYRDDELDRSHPLGIMVGELATSGVMERVKLEPLSPEAVAELADAHAVDVEELYRKTAGNPFFVVEALAADVEEIPETVRDAVLARVARLSHSARGLLEAVALVPPRAELWLLEDLAGDDIEALEEGLASGMLTAGPSAVAFRHELARLAVEESVAPNRRVDLHRRALRVLCEPPVGAPDLARLAHHAEAAGDADAVRFFAPSAAERARSLGAHREAAAQYARALRFGDRLSPDERADLLERRSRECYLTDQYDEGIAALEQALEFRRGLGDTLGEGSVLTQLSSFLWCPGRTAESEQAAREAVALLEQSPPGRELVLAHSTLAAVCTEALRFEEAIAWDERALDLAERLGDAGLANHVRGWIGRATHDTRLLERCLDDARRACRGEQEGGLYISLGGIAVDDHRSADAERWLDEGIAYCSDRGYELFRLYLLAYRARFELNHGRWPDAADTAAAVLRIPRTSTSPRIAALAVLALVRARRGDPEVWPLLDEAWALAEPTNELPRIGPVAAARAEAAWLAGAQAAVDKATASTLELSTALGAPWLIGELAVWRRRAGLDTPSVRGAAEPYALELAGEHEAAARLWSELGCPYEAALALAQGGESELPKRALEELQRMGAHPAATIVSRRLRERGVRGVPRGPRPATRGNPAGLTAREREVLGLLAEGLRNAEIAERLVLSTRTIDFHVSAILRKLDSGTRGEAVAAARRGGLL